VLQKDYIAGQPVSTAFPNSIWLSGNISAVFPDFADLEGYADLTDSTYSTPHGKFEEKQVPEKFNLNTFHGHVSTEE
jgi:hypothetical protein